MILQLVLEVVRVAVPAVPASPAPGLAPGPGPGEGLPEGQCTGPSARRAPGPEGSPHGLQVKPLRQQRPAVASSNNNNKLSSQLRAARSTPPRLASGATRTPLREGGHSGKTTTTTHRTAVPRCLTAPRRASGLLPALPPDQTASQGCSSLTESLGWAGRAGLPGCRRSAAPSHAPPCHAELCRAAPSRAHGHCGGGRAQGGRERHGAPSQRPRPIQVSGPLPHLLLLPSLESMLFLEGETEQAACSQGQQPDPVH